MYFFAFHGKLSLERTTLMHYDAEERGKAFFSASC